jgi:hypothetical protein
MQQTTITFDGSAFHLAPGQNVPALRQAIESAARRGGGLVDLTLADDTAVSLLVTANLPLMVAERWRADDEADAEGATVSFDPDDLDF